MILDERFKNEIYCKIRCIVYKYNGITARIKVQDDSNYTNAFSDFDLCK